VASVDLSHLAQAVPGDRVRFVPIGVDEAQDLLRAARAQLDRIARNEPRNEPAVGVFDEDSGAPLAAPAYDVLADALAVSRGPSNTRANAVCAAMPGLIVSVAVGPGDVVAAGQPLVVLEAMKMQSPVRAPRGGRVRRVLAMAGAFVEGGAALVELEDAETRGD
jgi:biotin carboxyl carrier protein